MKAAGWMLVGVVVLLAAYVTVALFMQQRVAEILAERERA